LSVVLYLNIPATAEPGLCAVVPSGTLKAPVVLISIICPDSDIEESASVSESLNLGSALALPEPSIKLERAGGVYVNTPVELLYANDPSPDGVPSEPTDISLNEIPAGSATFSHLAFELL
jgi:hypothetical protein